MLAAEVVCFLGKPLSAEQEQLKGLAVQALLRLSQQPVGAAQLGGSSSVSSDNTAHALITAVGQRVVALAGSCQPESEDSKTLLAALQLLTEYTDAAARPSVAVQLVRQCLPGLQALMGVLQASGLDAACWSTHTWQLLHAVVLLAAAACRRCEDAEAGRGLLALLLGDQQVAALLASAGSHMLLQPERAQGGTLAQRSRAAALQRDLLQLFAALAALAGRQPPCVQGPHHFRDTEGRAASRVSLASSGLDGSSSSRCGPAGPGQDLLLGEAMVEARGGGDVCILARVPCRGGIASYARAHVHGLGRIPRDTGARSAATLPTGATATCLQASALAEVSPGGTLFSSLGSSSARTLAWCSASWTTRPATAVAVPAAAPSTEQGAGQGPRRGRHPNPGLPDHRQLALRPLPRRRTCGCARACWSCCARCSAPQAAPLQQTSLFQVGMFTRCGLTSPTACLLGSAVVVLCPCNMPPAPMSRCLKRPALPPAPPADFYVRFHFVQFLKLYHNPHRDHQALFLCRQHMDILLVLAANKSPHIRHRFHQLSGGSAQPARASRLPTVPPRTCCLW